MAEAQFQRALSNLDTSGMNVEAIQKKENDIKKGFINEMESKINEFRKNYLEKKLCSHPDDTVRRTALEMVSEKHQLSKIYSIEGFEKSIEERLSTIIPEAINNLKNAILSYNILLLQQQIPYAQGKQAQQLLEQLQELYQTRKELALMIGERVVNPRLKN